MSSGRVLPIVLSGLLGGAGGGAAVWFLARAQDSDRVGAKAEKPDNKSRPSGSSEAGDVESRLRELEARLASLRRKTAAKEALAAYTAAMGKPERAGGEGGAGASLGMAAMIDEDDPTFELAVRGVMDRIQAQREKEREASRMVRQQDRARRLTNLFAEELQLSDDQRKKVEEILASQFQRSREQWHSRGDAGADRPLTRRQWRERADQMQKQTETQLAEVLSDSQLELFREIRDEEGLGMGPGPGRGGGRRGGREPAPAAPAGE
jgi:hypothetical protein